MGSLELTLKVCGRTSKRSHLKPTTKLEHQIGYSLLFSCNFLNYYYCHFEICLIRRKMFGPDNLNLRLAGDNSTNHHRNNNFNINTAGFNNLTSAGGIDLDPTV